MLLNIAEVFEEQVVKVTEQRLMRILTNLQQDTTIQRKFRVLADISINLHKLNVVLKEGMDKNIKDKYEIKRNDLINQRDNIYLELEEEGLEVPWINTIVKNERKKLDEIIDEVRENATKEQIGDI